MSGHTPGPWAVEYRGNKRARINGDGWIGLAKVVVRMNGSVMNCPDGEANARLIAAAPDLLEALRMIAEGPWPDDVDDPQKQAIWDEKIARAAIAKAEGRT